MKKLLVISIYILLFSIFTPQVKAQTIIFQDDFEGSINPAWQNQLNSFVISQDEAQSGNYSVTTNGVIDRVLIKDLGITQSNTKLEGWFFDNMGSVEETLISISEVNLLDEGSSQKLFSFGLDTRQSSTHYSYFLGWNSYTTSILRSPGWHKVSITTDGINNTALIDDNNVVATTFQKDWRYITLYANGWEGSIPHSYSYWDNIQVTDLSGPSLEDRVAVLEQQVNEYQQKTNQLEIITEQLSNAIDMIFSYLKALPEGIRNKMGF